MEFKDTNPKDAVGIRKAGMSCVPAEVLIELGLAMMEGARKYGRHNYRAVGVRASVYYDAALRHLFAWWEGEDIDPDSGISHLTKAMACLVVIRDSIVCNNWSDDRPPSLVNGWQTDLNKKAGDLIDRLPESKEAYTRTSLDTKINRPSFPEDFQMGELVEYGDVPARERECVETTYREGSYVITKTPTRSLQVNEIIPLVVK